ncbi:MAG: M14 family metallocarboxypeptidase [Verrucomicrobia bacterium]|nr:M14 family metallocarboxypeptidase [Verrucomicrobiota bacterium]
MSAVESSGKGPLDPRKRGLNRGGYHGERIDVWSTLAQIDHEAQRRGWEVTPLNTPPDAYLPAYRRTRAGAARNVYISAGIHGDEPAGLRAIVRLLVDDRWPESVNCWLVPCLNPGGFEKSTREDEDGVDLNRDYKTLRTSRVRSHIAWLKEQPAFDLALLLHEDWESGGFYIYELNPDSQPSIAEAMVRAVAKNCPIEVAAEIDGRPASGGMIRFVGRIPERSEWPEALWLIENKTRHNYTLEAPSDFPLDLRAEALAIAVQAAMETLRSV